MKRRTAILCAACYAFAARSALSQETSPDSFYQLKVTLTTQGGSSTGLDLYRGHPVIISMFYGSCPAACPMLITGIQNYETHLEPAARQRLRVLLVSFDAVRDTPAQLQSLARMHGTDPQRWTFTSAPERDARKVAALLGIQYRQRPDGDFDHSQLITLLDAQGRVLASTSKIVSDEKFLSQLRSATASAPP